MDPPTPRLASEAGIELSSVLSDMGDSLSTIILSTLTEQYSDIQSACLALASQTNSLVGIVQKLAVASGDAEYQKAVTGVIHELSLGVTELVTAFTSFLKSPRAAASKRSFSDAVQKVGHGVDKLLLTLDRQSSLKVIAWVKEALLASKAIGEYTASGAGGSTLRELTQTAMEKNDKLSQLVWAVGTGTPDSEKRVLLLQALASLKEGDRDFKEAIHELSRDPSRSDHLAAATNGLASAYRTLLQAANIQRTSYFASTWDRVEQGANQIWQSLHLGEDLVNGARQLNAVALQSPEDFNEIAKRVAAMAIELAKQGQSILEQEQDPVARYAIEQAILHIRGVCTQLINKGKALAANPSDEQLKREVKNKVDEIEEAIEQLKSAISLSSGNWPPDSKLQLITRYIADQAQQLANANAAPARDKAASQLQALTTQLLVDANELAKQPGNMASQGQIKGIAAEVKKHGDAMVTAAKAGQSTSGPYQQLLGELGALHSACNLPPFQGGAFSAASTSQPTNEENELIKAAREQAQVSLKLADEVEAAAGGNPQTARAIAQLRNAAQKVIQAAHNAAAKPGNAEAQRELADAQQKLAAAIRVVVDSHEHSRGNNAVKEAMREVENASATRSSPDGRANGVLNSANNMIAAIDRALSKARPSSEEALSSSKDVSEQARALSKMLRDMAATVDNPAVKAQLLECAKIINDRSVQVKILTAVTAASGQVQTGQVRQALEGLRRSVKEVIGVLCAASLKQQLRNTQLQTEAIKKVLAAIQQSA